LRVVSAVDSEYERVFEDSFSIFDKSAKKVRVTFPDHRFPEDAMQRSKEANEKADTIEQENFINLLGFQVKELDSKALNELGIEGGVEVYRVDDGAAREAGILQGDIIARLNNMSFDDIYKFKDVVKDLPQNRAIPVLIFRQKKPFFIVLKLDK
jgi:serine protease Do